MNSREASLHSPKSFAEALAGTKIVLLLVNFRPGYAAPWMRIENYEQISLPPLGDAAAISPSACWATTVLWRRCCR